MEKSSQSVLVDLDMVLTDFHSGFDRVWKERYPEREVITLEDRKSFYLTKDYAQEFEQDIEAVINSEGFLMSLDPLPGALEGFRWLTEQYERVRICSTSLRNPYSNGEKWRWVEKHLGQRYANSLIICDDKTLIQGTYLIDDRPSITGEVTPTWHHILFDQPYNRHVSGPRITWESVSNLDALCRSY